MKPITTFVRLIAALIVIMVLMTGCNIEPVSVPTSSATPEPVYTQGIEPTPTPAPTPTPEPSAQNECVPIPEALESDFEYEVIEDGTAIITHYKGIRNFGSWDYIQAVSVPDVMDGHTVSGIGEDAFASCGNLVAVKIPGGVKSIGEGAFFNCGLSSIILSEGLVSIGRNAFSGCDMLSIVRFPDSLVSIGEGAFSGCTHMFTVEIPAGVSDIGAGAFSDCGTLAGIEVSKDNSVYESIDGILFDKKQKLLHTYPRDKNDTEYTIPEGILAIGDRAFIGCWHMYSISIPSSVTTIGRYAFSKCQRLCFFEIPAGVARIGGGAFSSCVNMKSISIDPDNGYYCSDGGVLFNKSKEILIAYPSANEAARYDIPKGTTEIADGAFMGSFNLQHIGIPNSVTSIGAEAFASDGFAKITIPESVTSIGARAFSECDNLKSIKIPSGVTSVGKEMFKKCEMLASVTLPQGILSIGDEAFSLCSALSSISLPAGITSIGKDVFRYCNSLKRVNVAAGNAAYISKDGVLIDKVKMELVLYPMGKAGTKYAVPKDILEIGGSAFLNCDKLMTITLPDGLKSIDKEAFGGCQSLQQIKLPETLSVLGEASFFDCSGLNAISIPACVTSIGSNAFLGCEALARIDVSGQNTVYSSTDGVLYDKSRQMLLCYPAVSELVQLKIAEGTVGIDTWAFKSYMYNRLEEIYIPASIKHIAEGTFACCGELKSIGVSSENTVYESKDGVLFDLTNQTLLAYSEFKEDGPYAIPQGTKAIGDMAFRSVRVQVTIPEGVTSIGNGAFFYSKKYVKIPDGVTGIGSYAFCNSGLSDPVIPDSVKYIGASAFEYGFSPMEISESRLYSIEFTTGLSEIYPRMFFHNPYIKSVIIPQNVKAIGRAAFNNCHSLDSVTIRDGVVSIRATAFSDCYRLTNVTLPGSVKYIGGNAFSGCTEMRSVSIPDSVKSIGYGAFRLCPISEFNIPGGLKSISFIALNDSLQSISIPEGVVEINAFDYCNGLKNVVIPDGVKYISVGAFSSCENLQSVTIPESVVYIYQSAFFGCPKLTLKVDKGSYAERFAKEHNIRYTTGAR